MDSVSQPSLATNLRARNLAPMRKSRKQWRRSTDTLLTCSLRLMSTVIPLILCTNTWRESKAVGSQMKSSGTTPSSWSTAKACQFIGPALKQLPTAWKTWSSPSWKNPLKRDCEKRRRRKSYVGCTVICTSVLRAYDTSLYVWFFISSVCSFFFCPSFSEFRTMRMLLYYHQIQRMLIFFFNISSQRVNMSMICLHECIACIC